VTSARYGVSRKAPQPKAKYSPEGTWLSK
jgi:hypothetical protein